MLDGQAEGDSPESIRVDQPMVPHIHGPVEAGPRREGSGAREQDTLQRARAEDVLHWQQHQRPISAETLRKRLHVGAGTARKLVTRLRGDTHITLNSRVP
ncbi:hypothetical protein FRAAL4985 [Frankia alni ACN14a]|uniref:Uncharacterized protein n=1 Tax=Frankia alni (strain DSM 45986 / CECT 9034 / ACN14a) TaxID=326424 RepID=Q0RFW4_FRAAA|nr:hypothetical protein FRAAL4985 [Frankia alni ACN14a]